MKKGMKVPTARKLPSGAWFCRVRVNGQDVAITRDTEKEAVAEAMAVKYGIMEAEKKSKTKRKTLAQALEEYIEKRRGFKSPSTIYAYESYKNQRFQSMMGVNVYTTTDDQWQAAIRREAKGLSPKYIKNVWMLISAAIYEATGRRVNVNLPQKEVSEKPYLDPDQIEVFVEAIKGESVEIAALLELSSLRRSEMLALRWDKIDTTKKIIYVHGARVVGDGGKLVYKKQNKNDTSRRTVPIIPPLMDALQRTEHRGEYVVTLTGGWVCTRINEICAANGLPEVGNHGLRHSFASLAYHLQIPEKIAMEIGGWADDGTMHKIYTHLAQKDIAKRAQDFSDFFAPEKKKKAHNGNENGNEKSDT